LSSGAKIVAAIVKLSIVSDENRWRCEGEIRFGHVGGRIGVEIDL
jgi:hypothetical protein